MAFDFLLRQLRSHQSVLPITDLTAALSTHFGVNHSIACSETTAVLAAIKSAIFQCANLGGVRFLNHLGEPIPNVSEEPSERPDGIAFFVFDTTVGPALTDNRLVALSTFTVRFALPLPQHDRPFATTVQPPDGAGDDPPLATLTLEEVLASAVAASQATDGEDYIDASARLALLQQQVDAVLHQTPTARRLFQSASAPGNLPTASPKMSRVLQSDSSPGTLPTYLGGLSFLDDQASFDAIFPNPIPLEEDGSPSDRTCSTSVSSRIAHFLDCCEFDLFASILRLDYVGTISATSSESIRQISDRLRRLSTTFKVQGQTRHCSVNDLFGRYLAEIPILPEDTKLWGFALTNYFWEALPAEVCDRLSDDKSGYNHPILSTLTTKTIQLNKLRTLRTAAVKAAQDAVLQDQRLRRMILETMPKQHSLPAASVHALTSAAESVMAQYSPFPPPDPTPPVPSQVPKGRRPDR
jgi:hypothetical protein